MSRRNKPEFPLTPNLERFKYEVADEIAIKFNKNSPQTIAASEQNMNEPAE